MPFYDLNVAYAENDPNLSNVLAFLLELGYTTAALAVHVPSKLPAQLPDISTTRLEAPPGLTVLTRLTLTISDTSQNHRIQSLVSTYDLLALRPTTDKALQLCCSSLDCDLVSLDLTSRLPFPIKFKTVASALQRGISGAASLIRATRGRGIVLSSEARNALGIRGPHDVVNLAVVWGLSNERGKEAVSEESGRVVRLAQMKRHSFRGVVDIVNNGTQDITTQPSGLTEMTERGAAEKSRISSEAVGELKHVTVIPENPDKNEKSKRKASQASLGEEGPDMHPVEDGKPLSKRAMKREAKKARLDRASGNHSKQALGKQVEKSKNGFPIQHEALATKKKS
ncbi:RNA-binding RNA processing protein rpp1 [Lithohypha guttulata]|uniref:RNA-binding RNA processing protein rpp1 n=1 Tax=Lithohypha guttulata TaxID=1690604 RepID=UPI00315CD46A